MSRGPCGVSPLQRKVAPELEEDMESGHITVAQVVLTNRCGLWGSLMACLRMSEYV